MTRRTATVVADPLDVHLYAVREAARLLTLRTITLRRWLEGFTAQGRFYKPVIREKPTGSDTVTWGEFLEAGLLREYRQRRVSLQGMRPFIDQLRRDTGSKYPLAEFRPDVDTTEKELVLRAQEESGLDEALFFLRRVGSRDHPGAWQLQWAEPVRKFIERVEFDDAGIARRLFPLGKERRVVIDPEVVFGIPQIGGIRTDIIAETYAELGDEEEVAEDWGIDPDDVRAALQWEMTLRAA